MTAVRRPLITLADLEGAAGECVVPADAIITPSARDRAREQGVTFVTAPTEREIPHVEESGDTSAATTIAAAIDHTNLSPAATAADITALCAEAVAHRFASVCVHPTRVAVAASVFQGSNIPVCAVVGFPSGAHQTAIKAAEAAECVADGAAEIDMVAQSGFLRDCDLRAYYDDIAAVRHAAGPDLVLKVIIEASLLDETEIVRAGIIAAEAGADFVKTSTGVYGQARLEDVALLRRALPPEIRIKAAGGIRSAESVRAFLDAGADRIGTSSAITIMWELAGVKNS